jgi:hypothetical protein
MTDNAVDSILAAGTTGDIVDAMLGAGDTVGSMLASGTTGDAANSIPAAAPAVYRWGMAEPGGGDVRIPGSAYPSDCSSRMSRSSSTSVLEPVSLASSGWIVDSSSSFMGPPSECS